MSEDPLSEFKSSLTGSIVIKRGDYDYFVHPITDGIPWLTPQILDSVCRTMVSVANKGFDRILVIEAMGIPLGTALSLQTGKPLTVIRKRPYGLPGERPLDQSTGYSKGTLFINGITRGDRVLLVDDVLSTGGTLRSVLVGLRDIGAVVVDVVVAVEKSDIRHELEKEFGIPIKVLVKIDIVCGNVVVMD
jgi:adenine phosphoribosyltransferase